jgi:hypothetical protein
VNSHAVAGLWGAFTVYPLDCTGAGGFALSLTDPAHALVPMTIP